MVKKGISRRISCKELALWRGERFCCAVETIRKTTNDYGWYLPTVGNRNRRKVISLSVWSCAKKYPQDHVKVIKKKKESYNLSS